MGIMLIKPSPIKSGSITVYGFKHAATVLIASSVALRNQIEIANAPDILDVRVLIDILNELGGHCEFRSHLLTLNCEDIHSSSIPTELGEQIHGAIYLIPVLLGRFGQVDFQNFGGCKIGEDDKSGERPINHILSVLENFGASFTIGETRIAGQCECFSSCTIDIMTFSDVEEELTGPLVSGATKTAILAAIATQSGETVIKNPYMKPDVTELLDFLAKQNYNIEANHREIRIKRKIANKRFNQPVKYTLVSDLSEIMTYISLAVLSRQQIELICENTEKIKVGFRAEIDLLNSIGIALMFSEQRLVATAIGTLKNSHVVVRSTGIYSDHQPLFALILGYSNEASSIRELVWKDRFNYVSELNKLGTDIEKRGSTIYIKPSKLHGEHREVEAFDLRAAAVLLVAALLRNSCTTIRGYEHLDRGYTDLMNNLRHLGGNISIE